MESRVLKIRRWAATVVVLAALAGGALLSQGARNWTDHTVFGAPRAPIAITQNALPVSRKLTGVDFLVIDEFDPRVIQTEATADLFGKMLENIFRTRSQNKLPTIFCTNSPNPVESFTGSIKNSIDSLMSQVKVIPVLGKDFRKQQVM